MADHLSPADAASDASTPERNRRNSGWRRVGVVVLLLVLLPVGAMLSGNVDLLARSLWQQLVQPDPAPAPAVTSAPAPTARTLTFAEHAGHPDRAFSPYFGTPLTQAQRLLPAPQRLPAFRDLLDLYVTRQSQDDNFTIRVLDTRTDSLLELHVLEEARNTYRETGTADWPEIDRERRQRTRALVKKYAQRGIPRDAIQVKWGRANQVLEARERDAPFIEYEMRLADYLNLSLLATEIGTVETFNQDRLVSSVGARSRYQMMPYILRQRGIHHYALPTAYGKTVKVYEAWHPLLTMEPAFTLLRGYVNAVGHEIPGLSAYHTGPGNIFSVFRMYLADDALTQVYGVSVVDAYIWALTDGFDTVSDRTTFRTYSRGYVPSGYGSLKATDQLPIDTSRTFRGERVQVAADARVYLSDLLRLLDESTVRLDWNDQPDSLSLYDRFRAMNPHFVLPEASDGDVPAKGDVLLTAEREDIPVRFFLPLGATHVVNGAGTRLLDENATFRFDEDTYRPPPNGEVTVWDQQYQEVLRDIEHFGFTEENRDRLRVLRDRFAYLAAETPTHYREVQLDVIETHLRLWEFEGWELLAEAVPAVRGTLRLPVRPPDPLQTPSSPSTAPLAP
ncbi:MAG: hypothetical protein GVY18_05775 [Bacteroidetes bacterium]|jgi:hypothetical protein|nr:hypothetical protein [Bacteroidota bacterium]